MNAPTLTFRKQARRGIDHYADGVIYVHHFGTGWQELVFVDHDAAARWAAQHAVTIERDAQAATS